jgi:hypothetical protein
MSASPDPRWCSFARRKKTSANAAASKITIARVLAPCGVLSLFAVRKPNGLSGLSVVRPLQSLDGGVDAVIWQPRA